MTKTVIEMAREAGVIPKEANVAYMQGDLPTKLERFAALVREDMKDKAAVRAYRICIENRNEIVGDKVYEAIKDMK